MDILFASSEAHPLIKTGGLADVAGALTRALKNQGHDVRLIMPAYPAATEGIGRVKRIATVLVPGADATAHILEGRLPGTTVKTYLVDNPEFFDRPGGPYSNSEGNDWPDNAYRFALFSRVVNAIATNPAVLGWTPELVHCNDWQTGLVPALLAQEPKRPGTVFTIHNLAYPGLFDYHTFLGLNLPHSLWSMDGLEFHGNLSFIKGGLVFADHVTTVSPSYAEEIRTPEYGCGLEGLLEHRKQDLSGILNGVDYDIWSPGKDKLIPASYNTRSLKGKAENKSVLQSRFGLPTKEHTPLLAHVGRLVEQKGIDLLLDILDKVMKQNVQLVILGSGDRILEKKLKSASRRHPGKLGIHIGYDEPLAHLLEAGADIFLMPSRFEPCGLNQIYSLRYGTIPVVRKTGGLADTVVDTDQATLDDGTATGFMFEQPSAPALLSAIERTIYYYRRPREWKKIMQHGMRQDFSWKSVASNYVALYEKILRSR